MKIHEVCSAEILYCNIYLGTIFKNGFQKFKTQHKIHENVFIWKIHFKTATNGEQNISMKF